MNKRVGIAAALLAAIAVGITGALSAPGANHVSGASDHATTGDGAAAAGIPLAAPPGDPASPPPLIPEAIPPEPPAPPAPPATDAPTPMPPARDLEPTTVAPAGPPPPVGDEDPVADPDPVDPDPVDPDPDPVATTGPRTVVSLTFDDGNADQLAAAAILEASGIEATFFVISGYIGVPGYLARSDLERLASAGHEIGGHTVTHPDLTALPADEVRRQICNDRVQLSSWGFDVRSFAYPFAATSDEVEAIAVECGYASARMLGDVASRFGCEECDAADSLPPSDPWYTKALDQVDSTWTLDDLTGAVIRAESSGGWVQFTFHNVCTVSCGSLSITESLLTAFAQWLQARAATHNTVTATVAEAVGVAGGPVIPGPVVPSTTGVQNPGLETPGTGAAPECWFQAPYGEHLAQFSTVSPGRSGATASRIVMTGYVFGDAKILPTFDLGSCAPGADAGASYELGAWYTATTVTQFAVYLRSIGGGWEYWTSSPWFAPSADWTHAVWATPAIPPGYTGISFGLNIFSNGELVTDDYSISEVVAPLDVAESAPSVPPAPLLADDGALGDGGATGESLDADSPALAVPEPTAEPLSEAAAPESPAESAPPPAGDDPIPVAEPASSVDLAALEPDEITGAEDAPALAP